MSRGHETPAEIQSAIVACLEARLQYKIVAHRYGIPIRTIGDIARRHGIATRHRPSPRVIRGIAAEYRAGASIETLMGHHRKAHRTIVALLKGAGVEIRPAHRPRPSETARSPACQAAA